LYLCVTSSRFAAASVLCLNFKTARPLSAARAREPRRLSCSESSMPYRAIRRSSLYPCAIPHCQVHTVRSVLSGRGYCGPWKSQKSRPKCGRLRKYASMEASQAGKPTGTWLRARGLGIAYPDNARRAASYRLTGC
jgi:hypothetical protein